MGGEKGGRVSEVHTVTSYGDDGVSLMVSAFDKSGNRRVISVPAPALSDDDKRLLEEVFSRFGYKKEDDRDWLTANMLRQRWIETADQLGKKLLGEPLHTPVHP